MEPPLRDSFFAEQMHNLLSNKENNGTLFKEQHQLALQRINAMELQLENQQR
jgi:hypothetical protein